MSRWSHEYPERDYSNGSYFGRDAGEKISADPDVRRALFGQANDESIRMTVPRATLCAACLAPADRILCPSCEQQVRDGAAEREG
jgi:hypothetical protein